MRVEEGFQQIPYEELNPYTSDAVIPGILQRYFPEEHFRVIDAELIRYGDRISTEVREVSRLASPPILTQYDHLGRRVDRLTTSEGWRRLIAIFQEEGIVAIPHERHFGSLSRVFAFTKVILAAGDAQVMFCPLSMTDGAARVIELSGSLEMKRDVMPRLISRDPATAFTAGQWMTERSGGSDLSQTETIAVRDGSEDVSPDGDLPGTPYTLDGFKWFSSAPDGDVSLALARTSPDALSLFLVPLRPSLAQNGIHIHRLKNKGGTHALPTAELSLTGTKAQLVGARGKGIRAAAPLLAITRLHSATASVGYLRRALAIAAAYARVRSVRGTLLATTLVHVSALAEPALVYAGLSHLLFGAALLLGRVECGEASAEDERRLRVLTPVVKAFSARRAGDAVVACMEALGGLGYMEETGIPRLIRDGLVERIWEGTTTILALDLVRATSDTSALDSFTSWLRTSASALPSSLLAEHPPLSATARLLLRAADVLAQALGTHARPDPAREASASTPTAQSNKDNETLKKARYARAALELAGAAAAGAFLLEHTEWAWARWCRAASPVLESGRQTQYNTDAEEGVEAEARLSATRASRWAYAPAGGVDGAIRALERLLHAEEDTSAEARDKDSAREDLEIVYGRGSAEPRVGMFAGQGDVAAAAKL